MSYLILVCDTVITMFKSIIPIIILLLIIFYLLRLLVKKSPKFKDFLKEIHRNIREYEFIVSIITSIIISWMFIWVTDEIAKNTSKQLEDESSEEDLISLLTTSQYSTDSALLSLEWISQYVLKKSDNNIENLKVNKPKENLVYEPISNYGDMNLLLNEKSTFLNLNIESQLLLPDIPNRINSLMQYYEYDKNKYTNYLTLLHIYNVYNWQNEMLNLELKSQKQFLGPVKRDIKEREDLKSIITNVKRCGMLYDKNKSACNKLTNYLQDIKDGKKEINPYIELYLRSWIAWDRIEDSWGDFEAGDNNKKEVTIDEIKGIYKSNVDDVIYYFLNN